MAKIISTGFVSATINGIAVNTSLKCNSSNYENFSSRKISYIVMHYTGNAKDTAKANANYFTGKNRQASAHFFVDNTSIYQSVELRDKAWHCGSPTGVYYHDYCRNTNSIGIEMCTSGSYIISDKTIKNAAHLCAYLCKKIGITADEVDKYVLRHYDVTHKSCPAQMAKDKAEWIAFKKQVKSLLKNGSSSTTSTSSSTTIKKPSAKKTFIKSVQTALGAKVDGVAGPETLSKTITVSETKNSRHKVVKAIQTYLNALGYNCGAVDGSAGPKFTAAVKKYQKAKGCVVDGEITARGKTWKKLLGLI